MVIASLFARLGLKVDKRSFDNGRNELGQFTDNLRSRTKKAGKAIGGLIKRFALLAGALATAGGFRKAFNFGDQLTDLEIASRGSMGTLKDVETQILNVSDATGVAKEEILKGTRAFVSLTGDGKAAAASMGLFARVNVATKASMGDIATTAAAMAQNLKILPENMEQAFSVAIKSGKLGAVELKDFARLLPGLAPQFAAFAGGTGVKGLARMATALQKIRRGFGSASEAATGMQALMGQVVARAKQIEKAGFKVFDENDNLKSFDVIIKGILEKSKGGNAKILQRMFGSRKEAKRAILQLKDLGDSSDDLTKSLLGAKDVSEDFAKKSQSNAFKIRLAWNKVGNLFHKVFSRIITIVIKVMENLHKFRLVLVALGIAFTLVGRAAIAAGLKTLVAWAAALAPFLIITALILAAIVAFDKFSLMVSGKGLWENLKEGATAAFGFVMDQIAKTSAAFRAFMGEFSIKTATVSQIGGAPPNGLGISQGLEGKTREGKVIIDAHRKAATVFVNKLAASERLLSGGEKGSVMNLMRTAFLGGAEDTTFPTLSIPAVKQELIDEVTKESRAGNINLNVTNNIVNPKGSIQEIWKAAKQGTETGLRKAKATAN